MWCEYELCHVSRQLYQGYDWVALCLSLHRVTCILWMECHTQQVWLPQCRMRVRMEFLHWRYELWFSRPKAHLVARLPIGFWIAGSGEGELDSPFLAEVLEVEWNELRPIVSHNLFGNSEATYHIHPNENFELSVVNLVVCLTFHPFGEVVCDRKHVYMLVGCCRKLPHNIHSPLHERPWRHDGFQLLWREVRYLGEALVAIVALDMVGRIWAHRRPVVACSEGAVSKIVSSKVVSAFTLVEFWENMVGFNWSDASEVGSWKGPL